MWIRLTSIQRMQSNYTTAMTPSTIPAAWDVVLAALHKAVNNDEVHPNKSELLYSGLGFGV